MKPRVAISMGDPGGVGPEVVLKALTTNAVAEAIIPVVVGDLQVLKSTATALGLDLTFTTDGDTLGSTPPAKNNISVLQPYTSRGELTVGSVSAENGRVSIKFIESAVREVLNGRADAICTAPVSKEAMHLAGSEFPGHTEMLAHLCGTNIVRMMLAGGGLRVILQTIHVALKDVPGLITIEAVKESLRIIRNFAISNGQGEPRIAVCGLNPHAGESGQFGREEIQTITPAIETMRAEGLNLTGPVPADTVFHRVLEGEFDYVLAMYHDQALIPVKTLDFHGGVNVTLGLPLIRTSPDHGTAFGIAGKNRANESSMVAALLYAADLAKRRMAQSNG